MYIIEDCRNKRKLSKEEAIIMILLAWNEKKNFLSMYRARKNISFKEWNKKTLMYIIRSDITDVNL